MNFSSPIFSMSINWHHVVNIVLLIFPLLSALLTTFKVNTDTRLLCISKVQDSFFFFDITPLTQTTHIIKLQHLNTPRHLIILS